jgi:hypothetical protein
VRWKDFQDRERRQIAVDLCIEKLKRFGMSPETAVEKLRHAAENDQEILLEAAGESAEEPITDAINEADNDHHAADPLLRYIDGLLKAAATGVSAPVVNHHDALLIEQERALLNNSSADGFADLAQRVPQLHELETEIRTTGRLDEPTPQLPDPASLPWARRLLHKMLVYGETPLSYGPKTALLLALQERLPSLVGNESSDATDDLARTDIAWDVTRDHLLTIAGFPPARSWDEPRLPTPPPADQLRLLWQKYQDIRKQKKQDRR